MKMTQKVQKVTKDQLVYCQTYSRGYERIMFEQMSEYLEGFFIKYQCGFRKGFTAQHWPVSMLEK